MKCELCHQADAQTVLHIQENGEDRELFVCKNCAQSRRSPSREKHASSGPRLIAQKITEDGEPPAFVKNLLEATIGFMQGVVESEKTAKQKCPRCKRKWDQIKESRTIGCPACWATFPEEIRQTFLSHAYGPVHIGTMPADIKGNDSRRHLERALKAAIKREDFKKAARLKRELDALDKTDGTGS